jgi:hypothetical protein
MDIINILEYINKIIESHNNKDFILLNYINYINIILYIHNNINKKHDSIYLKLTLQLIELKRIKLILTYDNINDYKTEWINYNNTIIENIKQMQTAIQLEKLSDNYNKNNNTTISSTFLQLLTQPKINIQKLQEHLDKLKTEIYKI